MGFSVHHVCIETDRYEESLGFYVGLLGFRVEEESRGFHGRAYNAWLRRDSAIIELQTPAEGRIAPRSASGGAAARPGPELGLMHFCLEVDDLEATLADLESKGFRGFLPGKRLYEVFGSRLSKLRAPEGTIVELRE